LRIILIESAGRGELLCPRIPYVSLGRLNIVCIRGGFRAAGRDPGCGLRKRRMVSLLEQRANPFFSFVVTALAKVMKTDSTRY